MRRAFHRFDTYLVPATGLSNAWIGTLGAAFVIALVYFLAAQVGLAFLAKPSDVAVFWPASGIAAGVLVAAGRRVGVALVVGVVVGTVAANLTSDRSLLTSVLKGFCNAGESNLEFRIIRTDGDVRWILASGGAFYDEATGEPTRILGNIVDITERTLAELSLADRNRQLELAGKAALVANFAIEIDSAREDFASNRMHVTPGFSAIYGLPEETVEISVGDWQSLVHPEDLPQFLERRQQVFTRLRSEHHAEFRIVRPCGTTRWIETRSYIEYDQAGYAKRLVGFLSGLPM